MSGWRDLDEYTEGQLQNELARRRALRNSGLCDYCQRAPETEPCKFPERHASVHPLDPEPKVELSGMKRKK
jgi:hypothetical protein